ncbi:MAG: glycosyltransferase family 2 protein [Nitrospirae bacterium]|nr:glycosyltransferase family 2 protein [Nitrospirota bacterium]
MNNRQGQNKLPKVSVIVLNWNGYSDTAECLRSLERLTYPSCEVILVDNGSTDGSVARLRQEFEKVFYIENDENLGFAEGNNIGIRYALQHGAGYVFLLNNDTVISPGALDELVRVAEGDRAIGMAGPVIYDYYDPSRVWFAGSHIDYRTGLTPHWHEGEKREKEWPESWDVERLSGCAMLVKKEVIESVGMLDAGYFLYYEDTDWCARARQHGFRIVCAGHARVLHKQQGSTDRGGSPLVHYYCQRNRLLFLKKNANIPVRVRLHNGYITGGYILHALGKLLGMRNVQYEIRKAKFQGVRDFYLGRTGKQREDAK